MSQTKKGGDYAVGYGKPPEHSRFQAGQSGNPKGRPKGSLNLTTAVNRALREKVIVVENGRRKSITKLDAAIKGLVNRAVKGDSTATRLLIGLGPLVGVDTATNAESSVLGANDAAVLAGLAQRLGITPDKTAASAKSPKPSPSPKPRK